MIEIGDILYSNDKRRIIGHSPNFKDKILIVPNDVDGIDDNAFYSCNCLEKIIVPNTLLYIGFRAFKNCKSLKFFSIYSNNKKSHIIEPDYTHGPWYSIAPEAFFGCTSFEQFECPDYINIIMCYAFTQCYNLSKILFSNYLEAILNNAFEDCYSLAKISLPENLEIIEKAAFKNCI